MSQNCLRFVILIALASGANATGPDARSVALGGAGLATARGISSAWQNAAHLALPGRPAWSLQVAGIEAGLANSAFSLSDYNLYNGAFLDAADKRRILDAVGEDGFQLQAAGAGAFPALQLGSFAFFTNTSAHSAGTLTEAAVEAALEGVHIDESLRLGSSGGDVDVWTSVGLAYGRQVHDLALGASFKWLRGHYHADVRATGDVSSTVVDGVIQTIGTAGSMLMRTANGGSGWALDLGVAKSWERTTVSAAVINLASQLHWSRDVRIEGVTYDVEQQKLEDYPEPEEINEASEPFNTSPPTYWRAGVAREVGSAHRGVAAITHQRGSGQSTSLGSGFEMGWVDWLPLRAGLAYSSFDGVHLTGGFGVHVPWFRFDLGCGGCGGVFGAARGLDLAVTLTVQP